MLVATEAPPTQSSSSEQSSYKSGASGEVKSLLVNAKKLKRGKKSSGYKYRITVTN